MFCFKLLIAAGIVQLGQAQQNKVGYLDIVAGENPLTFIHPETPASIGTGMYSNIFTSIAECFLAREVKIYSTVSTFNILLTNRITELDLEKVTLTDMPSIGHCLVFR
jgi:hypothetical protein